MKLFSNKEMGDRNAGMRGSARERERWKKLASRLKSVIVPAKTREINWPIERIATAMCVEQFLYNCFNVLMKFRPKKDDDTRYNGGERKRRKQAQILISSLLRFNSTQSLSNEYFFPRTRAYICWLFECSPPGNFSK